MKGIPVICEKCGGTVYLGEDGGKGNLVRHQSSAACIPRKVARQSWDEYFLGIAKQVASRSTCRRHQVGSIAVRDRRILSTGYNGAASGVKDCLELGCLRGELGIPSGTRQEICRAIHAEQNVIIQAHESLHESTIYCTHSPCILCAKMLANAKIERLVCSNKYEDSDFLELFQEAGIKYEMVI